MSSVATFDTGIILFYFGLILFAGFWVSRISAADSSSFFLANRSIGWIAIGTSLFAANISSEHIVGLAGYGASRGLAVGSIELLAIPFLIFLGWWLAPLFLKTKVFTVPEFLGKRFNAGTRLILSGISIFAYVLTKISVSLYAGGLLLNAILGWDMHTSAILMVVITGLYTIVGGLRAVVYTSVIQSAFLILGAVIITFLGLQEVGGIAGLQSKLPADYFSILKPVSDPDFPWTGILFGAPILAIWYWCTDQYIVQRIFSARDLQAARKGSLLTAFLKTLPIFTLVLPGLLAAALFPGISGDDAFPALVSSSILPDGLKGIVLAGVLSALMSSLSACFISTSTLFTMDFYRYFNPAAGEKKLVLIGRLATIAMVVVGILWVPLVKLINSHVYIHLQSVQAYISPPIAAVFLMGLFWKRANGRGAIISLCIGEAFGALRLSLELFGSPGLADSHAFGWFLGINFLHFAVLSFILSILMMILGSLLTDAPEIQYFQENI